MIRRQFKGKIQSRKLRNSIELKRKFAKMQVTVLKFWNYSKSSTITTQTSYVQWIHSPFLLLCSSELLDWLLIMEKGDCLPSSQHLLRSIGFLTSHLLSKLLRDLTNALRVVCMPLVLPSICWLKGLYRNPLVWPILTISTQLHMVHYTLHSNCFLVCLMVHWTESPLPSSCATA